MVRFHVPLPSIIQTDLQMQVGFIIIVNTQMSGKAQGKSGLKSQTFLSLCVYNVATINNSMKMRYPMGKRLAIIIGVALIAASALIVYANKASKESSTDSNSSSQNLSVEYPGLAEDNIFKISTGQAVLDTFSSGTGVVFLGFKECPWCQKLAPLVDEAAKAEGIEDVLYLDIRNSRQVNDDVYQQLVDKLSQYLEKDEDGNARIYVPDVSIVRNGEIVARFEQESAPASESTPDTYWTDERKEKAIEQLRGHFADLN